MTDRAPWRKLLAGLMSTLRSWPSSAYLPMVREMTPDNDTHVAFLEDQHGIPDGLYLGRDSDDAMLYAEGWSSIAPAYIFPRWTGVREDADLYKDAQTYDSEEGLA
jgi:hypothetical protein